jgi:predicted amidophosphoribosyltransferase
LAGKTSANELPTMLWRNDGSIAAMSYWCPRCERFAPTATCPGCGTQIVEYWAARVRWCLIAASVADALGTLAAGGSLAAWSEVAS